MFHKVRKSKIFYLFYIIFANQIAIHLKSPQGTLWLTLGLHDARVRSVFLFYTLPREF
ncbi:MAG: hypothetical protein UX15_C0012G0015 [Parcubacteria group bacterium GW2011_GWA1_45_7]|nr:MAG: hypothetical protein UX15_C0012G0015 [Parcubacteria group bacterium GW2011_GWA1_45_7]KKU47513.1 MAG: hypothetical protein UX66_C0011G0007 [Parcubacteria group bacterium GW2011_GWF2_46_8]